MANPIKIELVFDKLPMIAASLRPKASHAVRETAFAIEAQAKANAPVDTGNLRGSIQAEMTGDLSAQINVGAEYGPYVEFGTRHQNAQPYLVPAAEAEKPKFIKRMQELLD